MLQGYVEIENSLLPISHTTQKAHIEITIDGKGNFRRARVLSKEDSQTIIPCTEKSGGRAGTRPEPHPLSDKLQYVAKDFVDFGGVVTSGFSDDPSEPYRKFENLLRDWCTSIHSHPKAEAVLSYVQKGKIIEDLVGNGILHLDLNGKFIKRWEKEPVPEIFKSIPTGVSQYDAFVRWNVEFLGDPQSQLHNDPSLFKSWIEYYESTKADKGLCYVMGECRPLSTQHPAKLRNDADKAKIISSNDTRGFTFRGRFITADEAVGVSYEVTQKAHNALKWLIRKQGRGHGDQMVIAWSIAGREIPKVLSDSFDLLSDNSGTPGSTAEEFAHRLNLKIAGYNAKIDDSDSIIVLAMDSASEGKMAITFYRKLTGSEFLDRIKSWHLTCSWVHYKYVTDTDPVTHKERRIRRKFVGAPSPDEIVFAAHGGKTKGNLKKATIERLLPCIIDGRRLPLDLVDLAVRRASNRSSLENGEWERTISTACAIYNKYNEKERLNMVLDEDRQTRDYLYGRLLALADNIEAWALNKAGETRPTTAARLMNRFAEHPFTTWPTIYLALGPYKARLGPKVSSRDRLISEIASRFSPEDFSSDKKLTGEFLLGYYCQREALNQQHKPRDEELNTTEGEE